MSELEKMSLVELRIVGKKSGLKNVTTYKKQELLDKLLEFEKENSSKEEVVAGNNERV